MGGCDKTDMSQKVMCCPGKVQVIALGAIFFLSSLVFGGLFYWQIDVLNKFQLEKFKESQSEVTLNWLCMVTPGCMFLSAIFLFILLKVNPKLLIIIGIIWPVISSGGPGYTGAKVYMWYTNITEVVTHKNMANMIDSYGLYIIYMVPIGTAVYILCAIYCIVLLICLGCCQRAGAGSDMYDFEDEDIEEIETSSKSHISLQ